MRYSIEPKYRIHVKEYGFLSFTKNMGTQLSSKIWPYINIVKIGLKLMMNPEDDTTSIVKLNSKLQC